MSHGDYFFARRIGDSTDPYIRKRFVTAIVAMNLTVLGIFKYFNLFLSTAARYLFLAHLAPSFLRPTAR